MSKNSVSEGSGSGPERGTAWPVEAAPEEIVRHLESLIPLAEGAPEIEAACGRLKKEGGDVLTRVAEGLRHNGALELAPVPIQEVLQRDPIHQRDGTGKLVRTVSAVRLRATPQAVARAIFDEPWKWWKNGKVLDWQSGEKTRFVLKPVSTASFGYLSLPAKLGIELSAAEEVEESTKDGRFSRRKTVFPTQFSQDFQGPGRYEIVDVAGGCLLRSVWDGVERAGLNVRILPMKLFLRVHLGGEKGDLSWPLPPGTGFPGLVDLLER